MDLDTILNEIHVLLNKDTDYPSSGDEDYEVRKALVQNAVRVWANEEGVLWNELVVRWQDAATGTKTITTDDYTYTAPDDFNHFLSSHIRLRTGTTSTYYRLIPAGDVPAFANNTAEYLAYLTGNNKTGYVLNFSPIPSSSLSGYYIDGEYIKDPSLPTTGTDVVEMSDPQFCTYWALAELVKDEDPGLASEYTQIATNKMNAMKLRNDGYNWHGRTYSNDDYDGFGI